MNIAKERDYYFDNAKFILILLIVLTHVMQPLVFKSQLLKTIYTAIYSFHIPVFVLIAGYFSQIYNNDRYKKRVLYLLILYAAYNIIYFLFDKVYINIHQYETFLLIPYWNLWFLLSLFSWYLLSPALLKLKHPIIISIILVIVLDYIKYNGYFLSISRTLSFLPFFLLGCSLKREYFNKLCVFNTRIIAGISLICLITGLYYLGIDPKWFYGSYPFSAIGSYSLPLGIMRLLVYGLTVIFSVCFLVLIPKHKTFLTERGSRTMYVFLLQGFFIRIFLPLEIYKVPCTVLTTSLLFFYSVVITFLLSSRFVERLFSPLVKLPIFIRY